MPALFFRNNGCQAPWVSSRFPVAHRDICIYTYTNTLTRARPEISFNTESVNALMQKVFLSLQTVASVQKKQKKHRETGLGQNSSTSLIMMMMMMMMIIIIIIIIIMYIYHGLINALSAHMIHINLNMIFYINAQIRCYRHWLKLTRMNEDRLPFKVHEMLCNLDETGKKKLDV